MQWRHKDGLRWLQAELPGATAAFFSRCGGVSEGSFASLNLGLHTEDRREAVLENRRRLAAAVEVPAHRIACGHQVHGAGLATHRGAPERGLLPIPGAAEWGPAPDADGQLVQEPGIGALVFVADCLPVALSGPGGVAMLHCGWRGLAAGILAAGAAAVGARAAAIGPGIGPCCFEVGAEVLAALGLPADGPIASRYGTQSARRHLDLAELARQRLLAAAVERVEVAGLCTACEPELFFSHRRDAGRTGRQAGVAWIGEGAPAVARAAAVGGS